ncbi:hypothetical protein C1N74_06410 [Microbacterium sp. SGAir0570]|nr:hypothetical protein C1N74_06410 [Microbacterium sp. SGAir0570]
MICSSTEMRELSSATVPEVARNTFGAGSMISVHSPPTCGASSEVPTMGRFPRKLVSGTFGTVKIAWAESVTFRGMSL